MDAATEEQVALQQVVLVLGGAEHTLPVKDLRSMAAFRRQAGELVGRLVPLFDPLIEAFVKESVKQMKRGASGNGSGADDLDLSAFSNLDLGTVLVKAAPVLFGECPDDLAALARAYAPELADAFDAASFEEETEAGLEVLGVVFPFVVRLARSVWRVALRVQWRALAG